MIANGSFGAIDFGEFVAKAIEVQNEDLLDRGGRVQVSADKD